MNVALCNLFILPFGHEAPKGLHTYEFLDFQCLVFLDADRSRIAQQIAIHKGVILSKIHF